MRARMLVAGLLGLGLLGPPTAARTEPLRVGLLPIAVHSSSRETDYLREGLADMLSARLERDGDISVARLAGDGKATPKLRKAVEAGRGAGVDFVVLVSYTQFGTGASLDVRCAPVTESEDDGAPEARRVFIQSGAIEEMIPKLDALAEKVARYVRGGPLQAQETQAPPTRRQPAGAAAVEELRRRVDALERVVYTGLGSAAGEEAEGPEAGEDEAAETSDVAPEAEPLAEAEPPAEVEAGAELEPQPESEAAPDAGLESGASAQLSPLSDELTASHAPALR